MANLGNTIVNGILRVNGKINSSDSIVAPSFTGNLTGTASIEHYGTCSTAAATTEKVVTCNTFKLLTGAKINVKFTVTNTASNPTLNVNKTGAKAIYYRNSAIPAGYLAVNRTYAFIYNGTQYELVGDINTDTNTDTKVTNTLNTTTKAYITGTTSATTNTGTQIFDTGVYLDTTAGTLTATKFNGPLSGNATSATKATTADKLTTARTINGVSFDGSTNITVADNTKLPLTGGTLTGNLGISTNDNAASVRNTEQLVSHGNNTGIFWGASIKNNYNANATNYGSGLKLRNGSPSEDGKWAGIAARASTAYSNQTDLVFYSNQGARMRVRGNDLVPEANSLSDLGTSSLKWRNVYATTFNGNASTATKLATARTIATTGAVTGSATFDGSGNVSLATTTRGCVVGQNGSTTTNPYYKFASLSISGGFEDRSITFRVSKGYGDSSTGVGILTAHFRTTQNGYWESGELKWEYAASGINVSDFILAHNSSASPTIVELWVKIASAYTHYHFDVISESTRTTRNNALWTLYNISAAGSASAITSGYTQVASTYVTLKNPISGNASLVSSTLANPTASSSYALTFHSSASTGSKSLLNNDGLTYVSLQGTTSAVGNSILQLGNSIASGTAGNKSGRLRIFSASSGYTDIVPTSSTNNYTLTLPSATGTVALTSSSITGNAATATKLQTARKIDGVSFNGSADIIHYGTCSTAAATVAKTVACTGFTLTTGAWIAVKFTVTNTGAVGNLTLNVNNTGAKNIKYRNGNIPSAGYLAANRTYMFVYDGTYYQIVGDLDTNTNTYDRTLYSQKILAGTAIAADNIIVGNNGSYSQLNSGKAFDISYPILYAASAIAASATGTNNYICIPFAITKTQNITLTAYKPVYIKGKLSGNLFTPVNTTPLTQAIPTSSDGYHYLYLGTAYATNAMYLDYSHELYAYVGNAFSRVAAGSGGDFVASKDKSITNFVAMTETEYNSSASSLPDKTAVIITDGGYVTTQATSLTCELPLDL